MDAQPHGRNRLILPAIVLAYLLLAGWYSLVIPPFEATDEISHLRYSLFLKDRHRLPIQTHDPATIENVVAHNPPLYYLAVMAAIWPVDASNLNVVAPPNPDFVWGDLNAGGPFVHLHNTALETFPWQGAVLALHIARLVSLAAGALTVVGAYRIGRRLFHDDSAGAAVAGLTAFLPSFLFTSATVHNDSFVTAFGVLALDQTMALCEERPAKSRWLATGLLITAAGLSKVAGFLLAPLLVVPLALLWRRHGLREMLVAGVLTAAPLVLFAGPWVGWNYVNYGEPFGYTMFATNPIFPIRDEPLPVSALPAEMGPKSLLFHTFVLAFGYMDRLGPAVLYDVARWVVSILLLGLVVVALARPDRAIRAITRPAVAVALLAVLLLGVSLARYVQTFLSGGHGRYLFPVLPVLAAAPVALVWCVGPRRMRIPSLASAIAPVLLLAIWTPLGVIGPGYVLAGELTAVQTSALAGLKPLASFDRRIELLSAQISPPTVAPLGQVSAEVVWRARQPINESYQAFVQVVGRDGGVGGVDRAPGGGLAATIEWITGTTVSDRFVVPIAQDAPDGIYEVWSGFYRRSTLERLPVTGGDDRDGAVIVGKVKIRRPFAGAPEQRLGIDFGGQLRLVGTGQIPLMTAPGATVAVDLFWEAITQPSNDYTISLQLIAPDGQAVGQIDSQPLDGRLPTSVWDHGEKVIDRKQLKIPSTLSSGTYRLAVVVYQLSSGARLSSGATDSPEIGTLRIER